MSIWKKIAIGLVAIVLIVGIGGWWLLRGDPAQYSVDEVAGEDPILAEQKAQTIPTVKVAAPIGWPSDKVPEAAEGLSVNLFASDLDHPRIIYPMDNGDVIVALTNSPPRDLPGGPEGWIMGFLFRKAGAGGPSADTLMLLRDSDADGIADKRFVLRTDDLHSPSGIAYNDGTLYVANHDAVLRFDYNEGDTAISGEPEKLMDLPAGGNHWMRNLVISPDGKKLYVAVGSASNIGENGMEAEAGRASIFEIDLESGSHRQFAAGLRNPNGLDWNPWNGELWVTVNERDMLGSDLVPDYLTNVPVGAQYGWPWVYWGDVIDDRVDAPMPNFLTEYTRRPEYALGPHVAALGLTFTQEGAKMPEKFGHGAFIARHGSWNRKPASGYDVVYVAFDQRGNPTGKPVEVLGSFLTNDGETYGRPTWVAWDQTGSLLVSDDTAGIIWRVSAPGAKPSGKQQKISGERLPAQRELNGDPSRAFTIPPADIQPGSL
ncbi:PQQ-dependent sugar dehydrogenase [Altericroceibacterium endophyticum]|uniref:Sorbosone dehydrogenase family protein n=1 Tax=Altericroceibacterium endophyticum TaxID=1808508 RepID=A0A6I4T6A8_9SPHN|nr:sorbosone dehydrogenase family protein [Altericroceibacterium endophyticum]MXO65661.1 sorbosone dehydrogenase family protein [Altericroceibacterium endophyticum]